MAQPHSSAVHSGAVASQFVVRRRIGAALMSVKQIIQGNARAAAIAVRQAPVAVLLMTASVAVNVLLAHEVRSLRKNVDLIKTERNLQTGVRLPDIVAKTISGAPATLRMADSSVNTVIYVFSPSCGWCTKNLANLKALAAQQSTGGYRLIGLSLSRVALDKYIATNELTFPIYVDADAASLTRYRLGATPQTIVMAPNSTVVQVWTGAYTETTHSAIEQLLRVRLPGMSLSARGGGS
jgi:peroxiredoxin